MEPDSPSPGALRFVYHLGVHKTGSTLIQRNLSANIDALRAQGVWYVNEEMPRAISKQRKVLRQLRHPEKEAPPKDALAGVNRRIETQARRAGAHTALLSEENRLGPPMHQELFWGVTAPRLYPMAETCLRYVTLNQPPEHTRFVLYTREPAAFVTSLYSEAVRMGQTNLDIDAFCAALDLDSVDFDALGTRLRSIDPAIDVTLRPFEEITQDSETLLKTVFTDLGLDVSGMTLLTEQARTRLDTDQIDELLALERQTDLRSIVRQNRRQAIIARTPDPDRRLTAPDWLTAAMSRKAS